MKTDSIVVRGARVHNLKNVDVDIPRNSLVVITGPSGSGKSTLAFDTIYAEGQRRYVESFSVYARHFLHLMEKPDVDRIDGLSPTLALDQKSLGRNPRSTVGTMTEIYDYLRILFARLGIPHCVRCGRSLARASLKEMKERVAFRAKHASVRLIATMKTGKRGELTTFWEMLKRHHIETLRIDGAIVSREEARLSGIKAGLQVEAFVALWDPRNLRLASLEEDIQRALELGNGSLTIEALDGSDRLFLSTAFVCVGCGESRPTIEPQLFSFNSPDGACARCSGLGTHSVMDPELVIPNPRLTILQGAIRPYSRLMANQQPIIAEIAHVGAAYGFRTNQSITELSEKQREVLLYGDAKHGGTFAGVIPPLEAKYAATDSEYIQSELERFMRIYPCEVCRGKRLKPEALSVTVGAVSIADVVALSIRGLSGFVGNFANTIRDAGAAFNDREDRIARPLLKEMDGRIEALLHVGLDYLTLDRSSTTLAGGEAQRIRLASQLSSPLIGLLYVLDEPSIGLHPHDNDKLITTLQRLRDAGNTVIVVEHDPAMIEAADEVIDMGPGAGQDGGQIIVQGPLTKVLKNPRSATGLYLSGAFVIPVPLHRRRSNGHAIEIIDASAYNLKHITVTVPLGLFVAVTGVSGSGKSTLVSDILSRALHRKLYGAKDFPAAHKEIRGMEHIDKVITIDQSPIGRTPRSNPATYTGVFTGIRDFFIEIPESRAHGFRVGHFSFNVKGGRCEQCQGAGVVGIEMQFLPEVYVSCESCTGRRYRPEILEVRWNGKNIADVLEMTVLEAIRFFASERRGLLSASLEKLDVLERVGLGYLKLGQPATTLSGGEAQRIKLATELGRRATGRTLTILDEPTTGLHAVDIKRLLHVLAELVDKGNSVLVIEHNLEVIKSVDWVIDIGPGGGDAGGEVVAMGTPEQIMKVKRSVTGQYLRKVL